MRGVNWNANHQRMPIEDCAARMEHVEPALHPDLLEKWNEAQRGHNHNPMNDAMSHAQSMRVALMHLVRTQPKNWLVQDLTMTNF